MNVKKFTEIEIIPPTMENIIGGNRKKRSRKIPHRSASFNSISKNLVDSSDEMEPPAFPKELEQYFPACSFV